MSENHNSKVFFVFETFFSSDLPISGVQIIHPHLFIFSVLGKIVIFRLLLLLFSLIWRLFSLILRGHFSAYLHPLVGGPTPLLPSWDHASFCMPLANKHHLHLISPFLQRRPDLSRFPVAAESPWSVWRIVLRTSLCIHTSFSYFVRQAHDA